MSWVILPAVVALIVKIGLVIIARANLKCSRDGTVLLVVIFALQNLAGILVLTSSIVSEMSDGVLRAYYVCTVIGLVYSLIYSVNSNRSLMSRLSIHYACITATTLICLILLTQVVVSGAISESYYVTAVKGQYYFLFRVFVISMCFLITYTLAGNYIRSSNQDNKIDALWALIALAPPLLITFSAIALMSLGFKVNALVFMSVGSTLFLLITIKSVGSNQKKIDPRRLIPFSMESVVAAKLQSIESEYSLERITLPEAMEEVEKVFLLYKSDKYNGNASDTAKALGIPRSTLYDKAHRLGISWKEIKVSNK